MGQGTSRTWGIASGGADGNCHVNVLGVALAAGAVAGPGELECGTRHLNLNLNLAVNLAVNLAFLGEQIVQLLPERPVLGLKRYLHKCEVVGEWRCLKVGSNGEE